MIRLRFSYFYAHERREESSPASPQLTNTFLVIAHTECTYKFILKQVQYRFAVNLGHSVVIFTTVMSQGLDGTSLFVFHKHKNIDLQNVLLLLTNLSFMKVS